MHCMYFPSIHPSIYLYQLILAHINTNTVKNKVNTNKQENYIIGILITSTKTKSTIIALQGQGILAYYMHYK